MVKKNETKDNQLRKNILIAGFVGLIIGIAFFVLMYFLGNSGVFLDEQGNVKNEFILNSYWYSIGLPFLIINVIGCPPINGYVNWVCFGFKMIIGFLLYIPLSMLIYWGYYKLKKEWLTK